MADLGFEGNGSIYTNQSFCPYYKMLWSWSKKLHIMRRYSSFVSEGTIKTKIYKHGDFFSVAHTDNFIKHFPEVGFTAFHNLK